MAPWSIYNATRFAHPVILSAQTGALLTSANCDATYNGSFRGYFDLRCTTDVERRAQLGPEADESIIDVVNRHAAWRYITEHVTQVPTVEAERLARLVGLYHPRDYVYQDAFFDLRPLWISWSALWSFYLLAVMSAVGVFVFISPDDDTPRGPLLPLLAPIAVAVVTVLLTYANTRFRTTAEPALVILAAIAVDAAFTRPIAALHNTNDASAGDAVAAG